MPSRTAPSAFGGGPRLLEHGAAVDRIARARCDRETRCERVGAGRRHESAAACVATTRTLLANALDASDCPGGVRPMALDACLTEARAEACDRPLDTVGALTSCRASALCRP